MQAGKQAVKPKLKGEHSFRGGGTFIQLGGLLGQGLDMDQGLIICLKWIGKRQLIIGTNVSQLSIVIILEVFTHYLIMPVLLVQKDKILTAHKSFLFYRVIG